MLMRGASTSDLTKTRMERHTQTATAPFLKWAGGKRWLTKLVKKQTSHIGKYFEPFLGSGALFFSIAPNCAELSDINRPLIETYKAIRDDCEKFLGHLGDHARKHSAAYFYEVRAKKFRSEASRAAQFVYLNRTCWNGLYRVNRAGEFNVPKGTKDSVWLGDDNFQAVSERLRSVNLRCADFEGQIDLAGATDFVFADPPYTVRHNSNGFRKYNEVLFTWEDQIRLKKALYRAKLRGAFIMSTNAAHENLIDLYDGDFNIKSVSRYSAIAGNGLSRGEYAELLITSW